DGHRRTHPAAAQPGPGPAGPSRGPANSVALTVAASGLRRGGSRMGGALALALTTILVGLSGSAAAAPPSFDARAWVLIDARDGSVIAGKAANKHLPIATAAQL